MTSSRSLFCFMRESLQNSTAQLAFKFSLCAKFTVSAFITYDQDNLPGKKKQVKSPPFHVHFAKFYL